MRVKGGSLLAASIILAAGIFVSLLNSATKEEENQAYTLYKVRCALCHYIERPEAKFAPSLKDLFKKEKLTNGRLSLPIIRSN